jgi:MFS family permease
LEGRNRKAFLAIFSANFVSTFGETIPQPFLSIFLTGLGIPAPIVGLIYNVRNIVQTLVRVPIGVVSDRLGRRRLMLIGLTLLSLVPLLYYASDSLVLPFIAMMIGGLGISLYYPPAEAYASKLFPPERVGEAMGRFHLGWAVSSIIGPSVGGFLAIHFPTYRPIFILASAVTLVSVPVLWLNTEDDSNASDLKGGLKASLTGLPSLLAGFLGNRRVLAASITTFIHSFCNWVIPAFFPLLAHGLGFSEAIIGLSLTANALVMGLSLPIIGRLSDRVGRFLPIISGLSISVVGFWALPMVDEAWKLALLMALVGLGASLVFPVSQAAIMEALPEGERGAGAGLWGAILSLGGTLGLLATSLVVSLSSLERAFQFLAASTLVGIAAVSLMRRHL